MCIIWIFMGLFILQEYIDYNIEKLDEWFILELQVKKEDNIFEFFLYKSKVCNLNNIYWGLIKMCNVKMIMILFYRCVYEI